jgi:hypothetical protein
MFVCEIFSKHKKLVIKIVAIFHFEVEDCHEKWHY